METTTGPEALPPMELWGGHECTLNRVGDDYVDQGDLTGHADRLEDIARFAALGISRLRYPILWERVSPDNPDTCQWTRSDRAMAALRAAEVSPIVGLVHHGSGPRYADLLSADFSRGLGRHAANVARRYPQLRDWTPVNEPLTTARFALLYGHWFPHARDERAFWTGMLNQIDGIRAAMASVRAINAGARLIQTEDLGRTYSTDTMADQAAHDNLRRWATWDLLDGRVTRTHPLWDRISGFGLGDRLRAIADDPCPSDIIGVNHYITSDRFLDHRLGRYPPSTHGRNVARRFADIEATRVLVPPPNGLAGALREAWQRYRKPIAVTELHLGCTREEQLRWLNDGWRTAGALRAEGADIRAVTAWNLLGSYDWDSLLTKRNGNYECGIFDARANPPRATAAAGLLKQLASGAEPDHPVLGQPGWWSGNDRLLYPPCTNAIGAPIAPRGSAGRQALLIAGATGTLGRALSRACIARSLPHVLTDRSRLALDDPASIAAALDKVQPWTVINAAGWVRVDDAETDPAGCMATNRDGSLALASACAARGIPYVTFSSDLVFDGSKEDSYREGDPPAPLSIYGLSKAKTDAALLGEGGALVIRTAAFFSPDDEHNFAVHMLRELARGRPFDAPSDQWISPTYVPDLVRTVLDLVIDRETGLWHIVNDGVRSWAEFAEQLAGACGADRSLIVPRPSVELNQRARRPRRVGMTSSRGSMMPSLDDAVERFAATVGIRA